MRAVLLSLSLSLIVADAVADLPLQRRELEPQEKTRLLSHARKTCVADPVEVSGFSYEGPDGNTWEAVARVYFAPYRNDSSVCKSRICTFSSMHPMKRRGERVPGNFTWGDPVSIDGYSVWPSQDGECLGSPSSKIALMTLIEEQTLVALMDRSRTLIEEGRAWLRRNHPDASLKFGSRTRSTRVDIRGGRLWFFPILVDVRRCEGPAREREYQRWEVCR